MLDRHAFAGTLTIVMAITLAGCGLHLNLPDGLYSTTLPALDPAPQSALDDRPSITAGHNRSHWQATTVAVPLQQVEHHPHYVQHFLLEPSTQRAVGHFPTVSTSLDIDEPTFQRALEWPLSILAAAASIIWAPIDMIVNERWPWTVERASASEYQRVVLIDDPHQFRRWIEYETLRDPNAEADVNWGRP